MTETIPVRADEAFSVRRVGEFLEGAGLAGFEPERLEVEQFPAGQSNLTYLLRSGAWEAVLRRPPLGPIPPRAHDMAREFHILERLHPSFLRAPQPYALCEDLGVLGAPFYVMERRRGLVLDQELPADWPDDPALPRALTTSVVRVLVELHAVDWQAAGLGSIGRPDGFLLRQVNGWLERYRRASTSDVPEVDLLAPWLLERLPESPPPTMIHNDYKLNNVLLERRDPSRVEAVLDWEMATVGDPLSDIAALLVYWTQPEDVEWMGALKAVTAQAGFPRRDEVKELYARLSGRDVGNLDYYVAFAYLKLGAIIQQIFFRWHQGQTHDSRFAGHGALATNLVRKAAQVAGLT